MKFGCLGLLGSVGGGLGLAPLIADGVVASFDADFTSNQALIGGVPSSAAAAVTTTRASAGYADDTSGNWILFGNNVPRITNKGLLVEEARTNSIRNSGATGAVPGTPGTMPTNWAITNLASDGLSQQVVGTGTENGIDYVDLRIFGTTTQAGGWNVFYQFEAGNVIAVTPPQTWTFSVYTKLVGGSTANVLFPNVFLQGLTPAEGAQVAAPNLFNTVSLSQNRIIRTFTFNSATFVNGLLGFQTLGVGLAIDFTLRIGWPQLELGAFETSPIRTTSAAVTRAADAVSRVITAAYPLTQFVQVVPATAVGSPSQNFLQIDDSATGPNNRFRIGRAATNSLAYMDIASGGSGVAGPGQNVVVAQNARAKCAAALALSDSAMATDATAVLTSSASSPLPLSPNRLAFGSNLGNLFLNGYVERAAYWNATRISNAGLLALTATSGVLIANGLQAPIDINFLTNTSYNYGVTGSAALPLTVTRASTAYIDDDAGNWTQVAANTLRRNSRGALAEEARTNGIRNNSMQNAVAGTPGTAPTNWTIVNGPSAVFSQIIGTGTILGMDYIDIRFWTPGVTSTGSVYAIVFDSTTAIAALQNEVFTTSMYVGLIDGSLDNINQMRFDNVEYPTGNDRFGVNLLSQIPTTGALARVSSPITVVNASNANVQPRFQITFNVGVVLEFTLRIAWPQCEKGTWASSPIRTTNAAVTRAGDAIRLTTMPTLGNGLTMWGQGAPVGEVVLGGAWPTLFVSYLDPSKWMGLWLTDDGRIYAGSNTGSGPQEAFGDAWVLGTSRKLAIGVVNGDQGIVFDGGTPVNAVQSWSAPGYNQVGIGHQDGADYWNGYIEHVAMWPGVRISNAGLQTLTGGASYAALPGNPNYDLNFQTNQAISPTVGISTASSLLTTTRASSGFAQDLAGNWTSFANNTPRMTDRGLLVEEARTQLVTNSLGMTTGSGQTWTGVPPNTSTISFDLPPLFPGANIKKATRNNGTADTNCDALIGLSVTSGTVYTYSAWIWLPAGHSISVVTLSSEAANWPFTSIQPNYALTDQWQRITQQVTASGTGAATLVLRIAAPTGQFIYHTGWQLEAGQIPTSFIGSSTGTALRAADLVRLTTNPTYGAAQTVYVQAVAPPSIVTTSFQVALSLNDGGINTRMDQYRGSPGALDARAFSNNAGVGNDLGTGVAWAGGTRGKLAAAQANNDHAMVFNGGTIFTGLAPTWPVAFTQTQIGTNAAPNAWNGYIERIAIWTSTRLSNADLKALTS